MGRSVLKAIRGELMDPKIAEHHGRIPGLDPGTKTMGDGLLVEFGGDVAWQHRCCSQASCCVVQQ